MELFRELFRFLASLPKALAKVSETKSYARTPRLLSSGDVILDRRREWALASSAEGFHEAAADIYAQILEQAPWWAVAWFELGAEREKLGDRTGAIAAYEAALARDPQGLLAADLKLAALGAGEIPAAPPPDYVAGLFDQYADTFDKHLVETLDYRGPELLRAALERACAQIGRAPGFDAVFDLGCGTGLMAAALKDCCGAMFGVDLSTRMVEAARRTGLYAQADAGDVTEWLKGKSSSSADLVIAADVFVYLGDLAPVFAESARALRAGGLFAFSVQKHESGEFIVGEDMRYAHSRAYLERLARQNGLDVITIEDASTRKDRGVATAGMIAVLRKP